MPQYKEKSRIHDNLALLTYPVLMAADILLFHGSHVPVGEDQNIHIEFCNAIATNFNKTYKCDVFQPVTKIHTDAPRVKSLADPTTKMSKSYGKAAGVVGLLDSDDLIRKKVKKAVTDSLGPIYVDIEQRPGVYNLLQLFSAVKKEDISVVGERYEGENVVTLKNDLADLLVEVIGPIRTQALAVLNDKTVINNTLLLGAEKASEIAEKNLNEIYRVVGLKWNCRQYIHNI